MKSLLQYINEDVFDINKSILGVGDEILDNEIISFLDNKVVCIKNTSSNPATFILPENIDTYIGVSRALKKPIRFEQDVFVKGYKVDGKNIEIELSPKHQLMINCLWIKNTTFKGSEDNSCWMIIQLGTNTKYRNTKILDLCKCDCYLPKFPDYDNKCIFELKELVFMNEVDNIPNEFINCKDYKNVPPEILDELFGVLNINGQQFDLQFIEFYDSHKINHKIIKKGRSWMKIH